jgi:hypothetical protein
MDPLRTAPRDDTQADGSIAHGARAVAAGLRGLSLSALLAAASVAPAPAAATPPYDGCTGFVEPDATGHVFIAQPGVWCLDRDHVAVVDNDNETYIRINANDVVLDCRGHRIVFGSGDQYPLGVDANNRERTVVRNCEFRGFDWAVVLQAPSVSTGDFLVEDNTFHGNGRAINVNGARSTVRRNRILGTVDEVAIQVGYGNNAVVDNLIDGVSGASFVVWLNADRGGEFRGNTIRGLEACYPGNTCDTVRVMGTPETPGISFSFRDNVLVGTERLRAVACDSPAVHLENNVISGFPAENTGCTDAGDNDITP